MGGRKYGRERVWGGGGRGEHMGRRRGKVWVGESMGGRRGKVSEGESMGRRKYGWEKEESMGGKKYGWRKIWWWEKGESMGGRGGEVWEAERGKYGRARVEGWRSRDNKKLWDRVINTKKKDKRRDTDTRERFHRERNIDT